MGNIKDIKTRIESITSTRQITKAMKMVAASKLRRAQENILAARPYADFIYQMLVNIKFKNRANEHKIFLKSESGKHFEPIMVDILVECLPEIIEIKDRYQDNDFYLH